MEAAHKRGISAPAAEWRAMSYCRWEHRLEKPPTELRQLLELEQEVNGNKLVDPGMGRTWKVRAECGPCRGQEPRYPLSFMSLEQAYVLSHILLTREGCKLVRQMTGDAPGPRRVRSSPCLRGPAVGPTVVGA